MTMTSVSTTTTESARSDTLHVSDEYDALMERLDQITPVLRENAAANEDAGRLVPAVEEALLASGAYKIGLPAEAGRV